MSTNKIITGTALLFITNLIYALNSLNYFTFLFGIGCIIELIQAYNSKILTINTNIIYISYGLMTSMLSYYILVEFSNKLILNILLIANISDICQYTIGYNYGTHFVSKISPKKTYEGYIAGLCSVILYSHFIKYSPVYINLSINEYILCFIYAALGDIISSYFKRKLCIKDWSNILGKHGGLIDRGNSSIGLCIYFITSYKQF
jgi:phosphatidate cytidylyltransferase